MSGILMPNDQAGNFVNNPPNVVATTAMTVRPATSPVVGRNATNNQGQSRRFTGYHRRLAKANTVRDIDRILREVNQDEELTEPERQALRTRAAAKRAAYSDREVVIMMDNIGRATTPDRVDELENQLPDILDKVSNEVAGEVEIEIRAAMIERRFCLRRYRIAGLALAGVLGLVTMGGFTALIHPDKNQLFLVWHATMLLSLLWSIIPYCYRTKRAGLGFMVNWVRAVENGRAWKGLGWLVLIMLWIAAL